MTIADIIVLGIALSADAFAVTISNCFAYARERRSRLFLMPVFFGLFQGLMPALGYVAGGIAAELIERYSSIVIFVILGLIGGNMIHEGIGALREKRAAREASGEGSVEEQAADSGQPEARLTIKTLLAQAVATAIDAFAIGISFRASAVSVPLAVTIIGVTTFLCCCIAVVIGRRLGKLLGDGAEVVGGVVLVLIGVKALLGF